MLLIVEVVVVVIGCATWDGTGDLSLDEGLFFLSEKLRGCAEG
jgi:hypothetical protein